jgi:hypothetical protein
MAALIYTNSGRNIVPLDIQKVLFIGSGALALILNLLTYQTGKHHPLYNLSYWGGSIILFIGLTFLMFRLPYGFYIVLVGMITLGGSFLVNYLVGEKNESKDSEILDEL